MNWRWFQHPHYRASSSSFLLPLLFNASTGCCYMHFYSTALCDMDNEDANRIHFRSRDSCNSCASHWLAVTSSHLYSSPNLFTFQTVRSVVRWFRPEGTWPAQPTANHRAATSGSSRRTQHTNHTPINRRSLTNQKQRTTSVLQTSPSMVLHPVVHHALWMSGGGGDLRVEYPMLICNLICNRIINNHTNLYYSLFVWISNRPNV